MNSYGKIGVTLLSATIPGCNRFGLYRGSLSQR